MSGSFVSPVLIKRRTTPESGERLPLERILEESQSAKRIPRPERHAEDA
jgi:hypothetical protein